ncbi:MAG TPA: hypothetical protein VN519_17630 [Bryobacteraceae bacterium]|nr:hypothetical protein [Bryobacteraceae bacterium]
MAVLERGAEKRGCNTTRPGSTPRKQKCHPRGHARPSHFRAASNALQLAPSASTIPLDRAGVLCCGPIVRLLL